MLASKLRSGLESMETMCSSIYLLHLIPLGVGRSYALETSEEIVLDRMSVYDVYVDPSFPGSSRACSQAHAGYKAAPFLTKGAVLD